MSNRLYSKEEPMKLLVPGISFDFLQWLWMAGLGTLISELVIYFMIMPEARLCAEHQMLIWFFLPLPAILASMLISIRFKIKQLTTDPKSV